MDDALLRCSGVDAGYRGQRVVRGLELEVHAGEVLALIGPNGAGKTTLLLTIAGFLAPIAGTIRFDGAPVMARRPDRNTRRGLILVPDKRELVTGLSVRDNLVLARRRSGLAVNEIVEMFPALDRRIDTRAGSLSGGEQQMLALGRALIQRPRALLIDEMSMGLAPIVRDQLVRTVAAIARDLGVAAIVVEQHAEDLLRSADNALVLVHGECRLKCPASDLLGDRQLLERAYLSG